MLVMGLAVRDGKSLDWVQWSETAWDAISFMIAFSGVCIYEVLCRSRIAGVVAESENKMGWNTKIQMSAVKLLTDKIDVKFPVDMCPQP